VSRPERGRRAARRTDRREPAPAASFALHAPAPPAETPIWRWLGWAIATCYAGALLAMVLGPHRVGDVYAETDFYGGYGPGARLIQQGRLDPSRYAVVGPGFEIALAAAGVVVRDLFLAGELVSVASMTAALLLWASLLRRRTHGAVGAAAALFLATNTYWFRYGYAATTDAFGIALQGAALWALLARPLGTRSALLAGACAAAAYLTRWNAGVLLPAGLLAIGAGWAERRPGLARGRALLAYAAGFAALAVPWLALSLASGARFQPQLHHNIAYEVFARARGLPWDVYQRDMQASFPTPWSVLAKDPPAVLGRIAFNTFDHLRLDAQSLAGWALATCALAGVALATGRGWLGRLRPAFAWAALVFLSLVPVFHSPRYSLPMLPVWAGLAAVAFVSPRFALAAGRRRRVWIKPALAVLPVALAVEANVAFQRAELAKLPVEVLAGARTVAPLARPGDRVLARKPHFAWHAGLEPVAFPFTDSLPQLAAQVHRDRVRWLWFSWAEGELRPDFWWLLDTTAVVPGLTLRGSYVRHPAALYEVGPEFGVVPAWLRDTVETAVRRARGLARVDTTNLNLRVLVALWERDQGRWAESQAWLERALRIRPGDSQLVLLHGDNLRRMGRLDEAERELQALAQAAPDWPPARVALGEVLFEQGRVADAGAMWRPVVTQTSDPATLRRMTQLFEQLGDAAAAAQARARIAGAEAAR
jgi:hypothetical protein